jgi:hypothetical protein
MTDGIEFHQPTKSECLPRHEKVPPPVLISAELEITPPNR